MKEQRWYEVVGNQVFIYDSGYKDQSQSVSIVTKTDLSSYRNNFKLAKLWSK